MKTTEDKLNKGNNADRLIYIGIGCLFTVIILNLVVVNPNVYLYTMYKLLTALGLAMLANGLTGEISIEVNALIGVMKAGGSLALMSAVIYFYPIVGKQQAMYQGNISADNCTDSLTNAYLVLNDSQKLLVKRGNIINIVEITGKQDLGPVVGLVGAEGKMSGLFGFSLDRYSTETNIPHGAAIFRFSNGTPWKSLVGNRSIVVNEECEYVEFNINDEEKENNYGFIFVKIKKTSK